MSSSLSETVDVTACVLADAFAILERERPNGLARTRRQLAGLRVRLQIDAEPPFVVAFTDAAIEIVRASIHAVTSARGEVDARIYASKQVILDILDAELTLAEAVLQERVQAIASLAVLETLRAGLITCTNAAVRADSTPALLRRFRSVAETTSASSLSSGARTQGRLST